MQDFGSEIRYRGLNTLYIKELDVIFDIRQGNFEAYRTYFKVKDKIHVYRVANRVFSEVDGLKFVIPFPFGLLELKETFIDNCYESNYIKGKNVLDIGAFIGDTATYFARQNPLHVFAYEPAPHLFNIASENIQLNDFSNKITLKNEAVIDARRLVTFNFDQKWPGGSQISIIKSGKKNQNMIQVQGASLESILKEIGDVGLLKMDIEGGEHKVMSDACKRNLLKQVDSIIMEVHGSNVNMLKILQNNGYDVKVLKAFSDSLSIISAIRSVS
jgi:FkbM family methyltransferase